MSDPGGAHAAYQRLLARPEVIALARRFRLAAGVRYEFVGDRASFHGKAQTVNGEHLVRLPANNRPEPYLLLTLLHEWAHLLVHRRAAKRRTTPHGPAWQREYLAVVQAAVGAGLFPGNEEEVTRHALAGEAATRHARLRGAEGDLLVTPPPRPAARFRVGETVRFEVRGGESIAGTIRRVNARTYTILAADGLRVYRVPLEYGFMEPCDLAAPAQAPRTPWRPGMAVCFTDANGRARRGTITRVNLKTLTVDADDGMRYRVGYAHPTLRPGWAPTSSGPP